MTLLERALLDIKPTEGKVTAARPIAVSLSISIVECQAPTAPKPTRKSMFDTSRLVGGGLSQGGGPGSPRAVAHRVSGGGGAAAAAVAAAAAANHSGSNSPVTSSKHLQLQHPQQQQQQQQHTSALNTARQDTARGSVVITPGGSTTTTASQGNLPNLS